MKFYAIAILGLISFNSFAAPICWKCPDMETDAPYPRGCYNQCPKKVNKSDLIFGVTEGSVVNYLDGRKEVVSTPFQSISVKDVQSVVTLGEDGLELITQAQMYDNDCVK